MDTIRESKFAGLKDAQKKFKSKLPHELKSDDDEHLELQLERKQHWYNVTVKEYDIKVRGGQYSEELATQTFLGGFLDMTERKALKKWDKKYFTKHNRRSLSTHLVEENLIKWKAIVETDFAGLEEILLDILEHENPEVKPDSMRIETKPSQIPLHEI